MLIKYRPYSLSPKARVQILLDSVKAQARAAALLDSYLTTQQRSELRDHNRIWVLGSDGKDYCLRLTSLNFVHCPQDRISFCATPRGFVPEADRMLAQMLLISTNVPWMGC